MAAHREEVLLEEYRGSYDKIGRVDSLVWQMAALMFPLILAAMAYFGTQSDHTVEQLVIVVLVAGGSLTLTLTWCFLALQWHGYQRIAYYRMREIETELGMRHYLYAGYMSLSRSRRSRRIAELVTDSDQEAWSKMEKEVGDFPHIGLRGAVRVITMVVSLGWIFVMVRELVLTL